jgi:hypothetical protein
MSAMNFYDVSESDFSYEEDASEHDVSYSDTSERGETTEHVDSEVDDAEPITNRLRSRVANTTLRNSDPNTVLRSTDANPGTTLSAALNNAVSNALNRTVQNAWTNATHNHAHTYTRHANQPDAAATSDTDTSSQVVESEDDRPTKRRCLPADCANNKTDSVNVNSKADCGNNKASCSKSDDVRHNASFTQSESSEVS